MSTAPDSKADATIVSSNDILLTLRKHNLQVAHGPMAHETAYCFSFDFNKTLAFPGRASGRNWTNRRYWSNCSTVLKYLVILSILYYYIIEK